MDRRTVVKGAAWSVPVITMAATAPTIAASAVVEISEACKLPAGNVTSYYQLVIEAVSAQNITEILVDGQKVGFCPQTLVPGSNRIIVGETENANAQINWVVRTDKGETMKAIKVKPCDDKKPFCTP
jgi:hypothetical protein